MVRVHKDPDKPKRYMTAFLLYLGDFRKRNNSKGYTNVEMTRRGASAWRNLTNREKFPYEEKSLKLKEKYIKDIHKYKEKVKLLPKLPKSACSSKEKKDPKKPKKALSAYMLFLKDFRQRNADCGWGFSEMSKKGATAWNLLTVTEKGPYEQAARKAAEKYQTVIEEYKKKKLKELTKQKKELEKQKELAKEWKEFSKQKELAKQWKGRLKKQAIKQKAREKQAKLAAKTQKISLDKISKRRTQKNKLKRETSRKTSAKNKRKRL
ncbi:high mobility group protein B3-like [Watersipora subatra]|uniref:high mobility group protein B3-like n=1 Tax=Watersipora subatra TaxID=2589382 RepID=UPI00355C39FB